MPWLGLDLFGLATFRRYKLVFGVLFLVLLGVGFWLGIPEVTYDYLGVHAYIWELLPFVSCFNPVLGIGLWFGFVVGDLTTKTIGPAMGNLGKEYWIILYLGMLLFALLPSIVARLLAVLARRLFLGFRASRPLLFPVPSPSSRGTMYDGGAILSSLLSGLPLIALLSIFGAVGAAVTSSLLINGLKTGGDVLFPSVMKEIWRGVYITLGNDPTCCDTTSMIGHAGGSIIAAAGGGATGAFLRGILGGKITPSRQRSKT